LSSRADSGSSKPLPYDIVSANTPTNPNLSHPFSKFFESAEDFFSKKFFASPRSSSPTNPNLKGGEKVYYCFHTFKSTLTIRGYFDRI